MGVLDWFWSETEKRTSHNNSHMDSHKRWHAEGALTHRLAAARLTRCRKATAAPMRRQNAGIPSSRDRAITCAAKKLFARRLAISAAFHRFAGQFPAASTDPLCTRIACERFPQTVKFPRDREPARGRSRACAAQAPEDRSMRERPIRDARLSRSAGRIGSGRFGCVCRRHRSAIRRRASAAPFTGLSAPAVVGPPFTAGCTWLEKSRSPVPRGFSMLGFSRFDSVRGGRADELPTTCRPAMANATQREAS